MEPSTAHQTGSDALSQRRAMLAGLGGLAAGAVLTRGARAGDLDPPAGPVGPTMKNLDEVEPRTPIGPDTTPGDADSVFRIAQGGSYYLTADVIGQAGKHGIKIDSSDVTLDLRGFSIAGVGGSLSGVSCPNLVFGVIVRGPGRVFSFGLHGLDLRLAYRAQIQGLTVTNCGAIGVRFAGASIVRDCIAESNVLDGFSGGSAGGEARHSLIKNCVAVQSGRSGFSVVESTLESCVAGRNCSSPTALAGITATACIVRDCLSMHNFRGGIFASTTTIVSCKSTDNAGIGIDVSYGAMDSCQSDGNTQGFLVGFRTVARHCVARNNIQDGGFLVREGGSVLDCVSTLNIPAGIRASEFCLLERNHCSENTSFDFGPGAGILLDATASGSHVTDNRCNRNAWGVRCLASGCFIARNNCSGNTTANWDIATGNKCLVINGVSAAAILGNSGGVSPGSTDPNANYTY